MKIKPVETRKWYEDHGISEVYFKKYRCTKCRYYDSCYGLKDDSLRIDCKEFAVKREEEPEIWQEMSYWHI